jgi:formylglycine-generating enzyme required for sulfatase activity
MRWLALLLLLWGCAQPTPAPEQAPEANRGIRRMEHPSSSEASRVALVIGNARYSQAPLRNAARDAEAMAGLLEEARFSVTLLQEATHQEMESALREFSERLSPGSIGLFYYAGHGVQFSGRNYLIPLDAEIREAHELRYRALEVGWVLDAMGASESAVNLVILDACRNNPFPAATRSEQRGLAPLQAPGGSFIAFATAPGAVAADGAGPHGLYTSALLKHLRAPGLPIELAFKRVRQEVLQNSSGTQTPWDQSSLAVDFQLFPQAAPNAEAAASQPVTPVCDAACRSGRELQMRTDFERLREGELQRLPAQQSHDGWKAFLKRFPETPGETDAAHDMRDKAQKQLVFWEQRLSEEQSRSLEKRREWEAGVWVEPVTGMEFVAVEGDAFFRFGDTLGDEDGAWEDVRVSRFWMARHEVTVAQWETVMQPLPEPPAGSTKEWLRQTLRNTWETARQKIAAYLPEGQRPAAGMSAEEVEGFLTRLNSQSPQAPVLRLPSAQEWEYACREGGRPVRFGHGQNLLSSKDAHFSPKPGEPEYVRGAPRTPASPVPVGSFAPNALGLYDLSGNVAERIADSRELRGGSFRDSGAKLRCHVPRSGGWFGTDSDVGLRLVRDY